jgi:hypothetical protein
MAGDSFQSLEQNPPRLFAMRTRAGHFLVNLLCKTNSFWPLTVKRSIDRLLATVETGTAKTAKGNEDEQAHE